MFDAVSPGTVYDQENPKGDLESTTDGETGNAAPELAIVKIIVPAIVVVIITRQRAICPRAHETATDNEEDDSTEKEADGPPFGESLRVGRNRGNDLLLHCRRIVGSSTLNTDVVV